MNHYIFEIYEDQMKELDQWIIDAKDNIDLKVKRLADCTGRAFIMKKNWVDTNPDHLKVKKFQESTIEVCINKHWNLIKSKVSEQLRTKMLSSSFAYNMDNFKEFADKLLPIII
jgi:hypothetical protein